MSAARCFEDVPPRIITLLLLTGGSFTLCSNRYHDLAYNGQAGVHAPAATKSQEAELRHQVRRLSHHPSIAMWDGGNEIVVTPNTSSYVYDLCVAALCMFSAWLVLLLAFLVYSSMRRHQILWSGTLGSSWKQWRRRIVPVSCGPHRRLLGG